MALPPEIQTLIDRIRSDNHADALDAAAGLQAAISAHSGFPADATFTAERLVERLNAEDSAEGLSYLEEIFELPPADETQRAFNAALGELIASGMHPYIALALLQGGALELVDAVDPFASADLVA